MDKKIRKYNSEFRNNLKQKILKLTDKSDFIEIYNIINDQPDPKLTSNRNGVYFNLNQLNDDRIEKLSDFLHKKFDQDDPINSNEKMIYQSYSKDNLESLDGPKLSNQERNILKKIRQHNN
jgi:hypothetical protein